MTELPSGTVTFLFTDIEGSTRLLESLGDRYAETLADHRRLLRAAFEQAGGREVDTEGDAFFVAFARAKDAVAAAVAAQRALASYPWSDAQEVRVRMGIHTGEPTVTAEVTSAPTSIAEPGSARRATAARSSSRKRRATSWETTVPRAPSYATSASIGSKT
jgi:class 3 adenylate cyclase